MPQIYPSTTFPPMVYAKCKLCKVTFSIVLGTINALAIREKYVVFMMIFYLFWILRLVAWAWLLHRFNRWSLQCCSSPRFLLKIRSVRMLDKFWVWLWLFFLTCDTVNLILKVQVCFICPFLVIDQNMTLPIKCYNRGCPCHLQPQGLSANAIWFQALQCPWWTKVEWKNPCGAYLLPASHIIIYLKDTDNSI